jgi:O-antigen/teichoic acid export membrane protein
LESASRVVPKGTFYIGLQGAVQYIAYFLAYVALTRILSPTEIGELPLLNVAYTVFSTITLFALGTATTKYVAQYSGSGNEDKVAGVASIALKIVAALSVPSFLIVALFSPQISQLIFGTALNQAILVLVIFAAVILNFGTILVAVLWGLNLFWQMVTANIVGVITGRLLGILLATTSLRLEGYFIGWVIGNASILVLGFAYTRPHLKKTDEKIPAATMLLYSYPILLSGLVGLLQQWADVTILYGLTGSLVYTGVYYLGLSGSNILGPIAGSLTSAVFPTLSSKHGAGDSESFRSMLLVTERALNVLVIPASFGLAAIAPTAVTVAYGRNYLAAIIPFAILIASTILVAYQSLMTIVLQSIARTQPLLKIASVAAVTEVILTAALVVPLNVAGSAMARLGMVLVSMLATYWYVKGEWWPSPDKRQLTKCLALSIAVAAILFGFDSYILSRFATSSLIKLVLDAGVFLIVYIGGLIVLKPLHHEDIDLIKAAIPFHLHGPLRMLERRITQS